MAIFLLLLLAPLLVFGRYGPGWAGAELAALVAWWLPILIVKPVSWRRGPRWVVPFYVFVMTTPLFALAALFLGAWLSPWWCLVVSVGIGTLAAAGIWPTTMRYYRAQRKLLDAEEPNASSEETTAR